MSLSLVEIQYVLTVFEHLKVMRTLIVVFFLLLSPIHKILEVLGITLLLPNWKNAMNRMTLHKFEERPITLAPNWSHQVFQQRDFPMITFRLAHNIFDCLHSPLSIIAGMMLGRAVSKGNIHCLTEICKQTTHIVCTSVTVNCARNTMLSKYRGKARNGFLSSVILDSSYNYISTETAGNNEVAMTPEFGTSVEC